MTDSKMQQRAPFVGLCESKISLWNQHLQGHLLSLDDDIHSDNDDLLSAVRENVIATKAKKKVLNGDPLQ